MVSSPVGLKSPSSSVYLFLGQVGYQCITGIVQPEILAPTTAEPIEIIFIQSHCVQTVLIFVHSFFLKGWTSYHPCFHLTTIYDLIE